MINCDNILSVFRGAFFVGDLMILIMPNSLNQIKDNIDLIDGVILSLQDYSVNSLFKITLDELEYFCNLLKNKEIFISMNKNIENKNIDKLEEVLKYLNDYPIKGVLYSDVAFVTYKDDLKYDLVWAQEHLTTNYDTINYWHQFGVNYAYVSSDITLDEINEIAKNTKVKLMTNIFGYLPMFVSKRHIVKNYLKQFGIANESKVYYIKKEGLEYPIIDSDYTYVFSQAVFNGILDYFKINVDYLVCNGFLISDVKFHKVLQIINNLNIDNVVESSKKIDNIIKNTSDFFFHTKTVSRVKKW